VAHETLRFSKAAIDRAGRTLLDEAATSEATDIAWEALANWRSMHAFPLNTITMDLRQKIKRVRPGANVVQRLKRARSMLSKLQKEASMRLTQMQDIGGCRAVVTTIDEVYALREQYRKSKSLHVLVNEDDYIATPKPSGYRSLHLVYRFQSRGHSQYNKLMFEVQLRTITQHAWATAVETVGAVIGQALKSSEGERAWLDYFQNAALALEYTEGHALAVQRQPSRGAIAKRLHELGRQLDVHKKLSAYRAALMATADRQVQDAAYFLLVLLPDQSELQVRAFTKKQSEEAYREYERIERQLPLHPPDRQLSLFPELSDLSGAQAVLVGADSLRSIRESYPNYYLDTEVFLEKIEKFVRRYRRAA
jgi:ppGpp synthetase/RelA/SpoT-type nucleotidyltranferase